LRRYLSNNVRTNVKELAERSEGSAPLTFIIPGESAPPHDFKATFRQWHDKAWPFKLSSNINSIRLEDAFEMLEKERFSIKELQADCLPLGVDVDRLEVRPQRVNVDYSIF
jgi:hypothetical protein